MKKTHISKNHLLAKVYNGVVFPYLLMTVFKSQAVEISKQNVGSREGMNPRTPNRLRYLYESKNSKQNVRLV